MPGAARMLGTNKWRLVRNLYDLRYNADEVREITRLIDGMMQLPEDLGQKSEQEFEPTMLCPACGQTFEMLCPRGHGALRAWQGSLRCWTCGWPDR